MLTLIPFVLSCFIAASTGILFPPGDWYERLSKPSWQPPKWLFAPVWTTLYVMIAISGWRAWSTAGLSLGLAVFALQLALNAAWTPIFFGLHRPGLAFVEIVFLWLCIAATILLFTPVDPVAAALLVPYLGWVSFAAFLNFTIWRLNRDRPAVAG